MIAKQSEVGKSLNLDYEKWQNVTEIICWAKWGKKYGEIEQGPKMLNFSP